MEDKLDYIGENTLNSKKKAFLNKFQIDSNIISEDEISSLLKKLDINEISLIDYSEILEGLELNNSGSIKVEEFLKKIYENRTNNENVKSLYNKINNKLTTKADRILLKLKNLKKKAIVKNDEETVKEFDWLIKTINEGDIYEPEVQQAESNPYVGEINFLKEYSHFAKNFEQEQDIKKVNTYKKNPRKNVITRASPFMLKKRNDDIFEYDEENYKRFSMEISTESIIQLGESLSKIGDFSFDIFKVLEICSEKSLHYISYEILSYYEYFDYLIEQEKFKNFTQEISSNYSQNNPYHNEIHGADVMQTLFVFYKKGNLNEKINLNHIDIFSSLIAALCHDYKHTGFTNNYEVNFRSQIALTYNDNSVLENYHIAETFKTVLKQDNNITAKFNEEQYRLFRRRLIECILATDMAKHIKHISNLRTKIETFNISNGENVDKMILNENSSKMFENQQILLSMSIHCCDISNPAKLGHVYDNWVDLVFKEFFNQGDIEKNANLSISILCDRENTNIIKAQIGFINFIVKPTFECLLNFLPDVKQYLINIEENLKRYEEKNLQEN